MKKISSFVFWDTELTNDDLQFFFSSMSSTSYAAETNEDPWRSTSCSNCLSFFLSLYSVSCFYPSSTLLELSRSQKFFCSGFHCKISASVLYSDLFVRMCRTCTHYPLYLRRLYVWRWRGNFIISLVSLSLTLLNRFCFQCSNLSTQLCSNCFFSSLSSYFHFTFQSIKINSIVHFTIIIAGVKWKKWLTNFRKWR